MRAGQFLKFFIYLFYTERSDRVSRNSLSEHPHAEPSGHVGLPAAELSLINEPFSQAGRFQPDFGFSASASCPEGQFGDQRGARGLSFPPQNRH